jgi:hypothetical protein
MEQRSPAPNEPAAAPEEEPGPPRPEAVEAPPERLEKPPKGYVDRAEGNLKEVSRLLKRDAAGPPQQRAMIQLQYANVLALLELADAIRSHSDSGQ